MVGWRRHIKYLLLVLGKDSNMVILNLPTSALLSLQPSSRTVSWPFYQLYKQLGISTTRRLLADSTDETPIWSPLTPVLVIGSGKTEDQQQKSVSKPAQVQAVLKCIKQVAVLIRGRRVEDALLQLQVTVKRAAKTLYQVVHSARANATHNHGLDPDRLLVGRHGIKVRPECRLTVVVRETTPEEAAKIARLKVHNLHKLTKREKRLVPHMLIETTPIWNRKGKARNRESSNVAA